MEYLDFLTKKSHLSNTFGFAPLWMPDFLFDFQSHLVDWALRQGRAALFEDCGLGKTIQQLVWAENVVRKTNKNVLIITPLAVSQQTVTEAAKFGIECHRSRDGVIKAGITVTNYERLHYFTPQDFVGVVCDESSAIKNFQGKRQAIVTEFLKKIPYRLLCTATAAPNDFIELGTSSEALGQLGRMDMLGRFFKNDENSMHPVFWGARWRFKGHAEREFWRWVCSWARAVRKPSDLGYDDRAFVLPPLTINETIVNRESIPDGWLFQVPAQGLDEQREERRATIKERCEAVLEKVGNTGKPAVVWCDWNPEGDLLEKIIPGAKQVSGSMKDEEKEETFNAFSNGELRVLVTKPKIGAFGLNWQHCAHLTFFPSHSFEQRYQGIRRCWRFGQTNPVVVDDITSEGESDVVRNLDRKAQAADKMFSVLVEEMNNALRIKPQTIFTTQEELPQWLS